MEAPKVEKLKIRQVRNPTLDLFISMTLSRRNATATIAFFILAGCSDDFANRSAGPRNGPVPNRARFPAPLSTVSRSLPSLRFDLGTVATVVAPTGKKVLLYAPDFASALASLKTNLVATGAFEAGDITTREMTAGPPSLADLSVHDCVIVWSNFGIENPVPKGDTLKEYVDSGHGLTIMTYGYSSVESGYKLEGGITDVGYDPFTSTTISLEPFPRSLNFGSAVLSSPLLTGVTDFTYGGNFYFGLVQLAPPASLIARDNFGGPLIAVSQSGRVAGINIYPGGHFALSAGVYRTIANACVSTAGQPGINIAPTLGPIVVPGDPIPVGSPITVSASFSDPDPADTHSGEVQWDLGEVFGTASPGVSQPGHTLTATASDLPAGVYSIALRIRDNVGLTDTRTAPEYVVVYDGSAGFVTGAGLITSPYGACSASVCTTYSGAGKARFGFTSRYERGATRPSGDTQFHFQAGDLRFQSTSYDWLVVAGSRAQFKGAGTVNGTAGYRFLLTAIDGDIAGGGGVDRFRIKIWNDSGVAYDNQRDFSGSSAPDDSNASTAIDAGSIVIHR